MGTVASGAIRQPVLKQGVMIGLWGRGPLDLKGPLANGPEMQVEQKAVVSRQWAVNCEAEGILDSACLDMNFTLEYNLVPYLGEKIKFE